MKVPSNRTASGSSPLLNSKSVGPSFTIFKLVVISLEILISFGRPTILERGEEFKRIVFLILLGKVSILLAYSNLTPSILVVIGCLELLAERGL